MSHPSWNTDTDRQIRLVGVVGQMCVGVSRCLPTETKLFVGGVSVLCPTNREGKT
jgi:hypothetical protein